MEEMCFSRLLKLAKDSAARIMLVMIIKIMFMDYYDYVYDYSLVTVNDWMNSSCTISLCKMQVIGILGFFSQYS